MCDRHGRARMCFCEPTDRDIVRGIPPARPVRRAIIALFSLGAAACTVHVTDSASGGQSGGSASVSLGVPATIFIVTGQSRSITVTLTRQGFDKPLTLRAFGQCGSTLASCQPLPAGITATFSPASLSGSVLTSTLILAVAPEAQPGQPAPVLIDANNGDFDAVANFNVGVIQPSVTVTRSGSGTGTVTSTPAGISCGNTCTGQFALGTNLTLTATAPAGNAFAGWSGGCTGTSATCNVSINAPATNITATFNSTVPSFALGVTPSLVTIPQGGSGTAAVSITRANGFSGSVNLAVSGAPNGLSVTPSPASVSGDAATLNIAATLSAAAGNYPLTVTATGTGVAQHTATFNVQVSPATGGSGTVAFSFATCDPTQVPIWFAVQNGNGAWSRVAAGTNSTFTFPVSAKVAIAYVQQRGTDVSTSVLYGTGTELTSLASGDPCATEPQTGTKRINMTVTRLSPAPIYAILSIGGADTMYRSNAGPNITLLGVPKGQRDLIASVHGATGTSGQTPVQRLLVRRNVNYADNANIPQLDMFGSETFVPPVHRVLINNLGGDQQTVSESLLTANGMSAALYEDIGGTGQAGPGVLYYAVPDSLLQPGDLHAVQVAAAPPGTNPSSSRFEIMLLHSATDPTITLGPELAVPTVTSLGTSPYLRPRAQLPSQSEYRDAVTADFAQNGHAVEVSATAGYFGGTPAIWTLDVPDLTSAGYDPAWGLRSGTLVDWGVNAVAGDILVFAGAAPVDGSHILGAARSSSSSASIGSSPHQLIRSLRRP